MRIVSDSRCLITVLGERGRAQEPDLVIITIFMQVYLYHGTNPVVFKLEFLSRSKDEVGEMMKPFLSG